MTLVVSDIGQRAVHPVDRLALLTAIFPPGIVPEAPPAGGLVGKRQTHAKDSSAA
jgi:hypothetical protein